MGGSGSHKRASPGRAKRCGRKYVGQRTILVVEDELLLRISTVMHLQEQGYRVLNAKNAEVAQRILGETHIDLVFSDIRMPGRLDGMGLAAWIRLTHPDVLVLLTTEGDILHPREHAFIDKPYRIADLIPAVAALLRGSTNETARRR